MQFEIAGWSLVKTSKRPTISTKTAQFLIKLPLARPLISWQNWKFMDSLQ